MSRLAYPRQTARPTRVPSSRAMPCALGGEQVSKRLSLRRLGLVNPYHGEASLDQRRVVTRLGGQGAVRSRGNGSGVQWDDPVEQWVDVN